MKIITRQHFIVALASLMGLCALALFSGWTAHAESPFCRCESTVKEAQLSPGLPCLTVESAAGCERSYQFINVQNQCAFDIIVTQTQGSETFATPVKAGQTVSTSVQLEDHVVRDGASSSDNERSEVQVSVAVQADGVTHQLTVDFEMNCYTGPESTSTDSGCNASNRGTNHGGWWLIVSALAVLLWRRENLPLQG
ncbi:MAG: hypothetical protein CMH53_02320 [Myxococcales bacterium]|nr:hypothetical protein [Myxococcales bacterium]